MAKLRRRRRPKRKKRRLSPEERRWLRAQRRYMSDIRTAFTNAGFLQIPTRDVTIAIAGRPGDVDAVFVHENIVVVTEDTMAGSSQLPDHLRKKAEFFEHLRTNQRELLEVLTRTFPKFKTYIKEHSNYDPREYQVRFVYCSRHSITEDYRGRYATSCLILTYASLQYFLSLSKIIHRSLRFELFKFLGLELEQIGLPSGRAEASSYRALLLPEIPSGFPEGHKLVSFLVDPATLLERSSVLRSDSWRDQEALYQRLLVRSKIGSMREYLVHEGRVFVNNIIVTLPDDSRLDLPGGRVAAPEGAAEIVPVELTIPRRFNAIGIIDGQHRVFAYHEGDDKLDKKIGALRKRQHLLVTGIVYPSTMTRDRAQVFEAKLFLEINDKQKRVKGDLKQSIERIVNPYSDVAIAKAVIARMAAVGPLSDQLEVHFFDTGKVKTASIVSYGLRHIVGVDSETSLFREWPGPRKTAVREKRDRESLDRYVEFCTTQLNMLVAGFRSALPATLWTTDLKASRALTTTTINGLVFCMRQILDQRLLGSSFEYYQLRFSRMSIDFRPDKFAYRSSHWRTLGRELFAQCFTTASS